MKKSVMAGAIALAFVPTAFADEQLELNDITVKANRFERKVTEATYVAEIYTSEQIAASGASTLYDFLAQQTSLNVLSSYGNKATPSINMRGYGNENGNQNIVVTLDGQRLNNIDGQSQLLGAIPLGNIERIEITKGSGSVVYGDGATSGALQIYTKKKTGVTVSSSLGNYGQKNSYLNAGISEQYIDLSASLAHDSFDGFGKQDASGHRDQSTSNTQNVKLAIKPVEGLRLIAEGTSSRNDIRYVSPLTLAQFKDNPRNVGLDFLGNPSVYTHQGLDTDQWKLGFEYQIAQGIKVSATHFRENKTSAYPSFTADYDYDSNDIAISVDKEIWSAIVGFQSFDGDRKSESPFSVTNTTSKDNRAFFVQTEYRPTWFSESLTLSAGGRKERVKYQYAPVVGNTLSDSEHLSAWDVGMNYQFNPDWSMFANYNKAYQAPDVDRFFDFGGTFNGFISPTQVKTVNLGVHFVQPNNRLTVSTFYARLNDEMYLFKAPPFTFINTNLDKSHKYGFEVQDYFKYNDKLNASIRYGYTRAKIDRETQDGVRLNGNDLPGVPKHNVVASVNYKVLENTYVNLSHTWRAKAYAYDDFQNNFTQKQDSYNSTNLAVNYQYKNMNVFTTINNLFAKENSIQVANDALYPVDFVRTWRVGVKLDF